MFMFFFNINGHYKANFFPKWIITLFHIIVINIVRDEKLVMWDIYFKSRKPLFLKIPG